MRRDPTYEELAATYPELDKAGQKLVEVVLKETPNSFGLTPPEAFVLLADAHTKAKENNNQWTQVVTGSSTTDDAIRDAQGRVINKIVPSKPEGRRAAIEHTKRKMMEDGDKDV